MKINYHVDGEEYALAGEATSKFKKAMKQLGIKADVIRRISISMFEAEINMVIHADGGEIEIDMNPKQINITLEDTGPGIENIPQAMKKGYSTASEQAREMGFGAGMGLPNMERYSDTLRVSSEVNKGTKVEMTFEL